MIQSEVKIIVLYAHTDTMGIVNNGRYFEYFEAGRNSLLRDIGYPYTQLEKEGFGLPVIEAHANYKAAAEYDDVVIIKAYLKEMPSVRVRIDYEVFVKDKLIVTGHTVHSFINLESMKPVRPPKDFLEIVKQKLS